MPPLGNVLTDPQGAARQGVPEALLMALQQYQQHSGAQPANEGPAQPIRPIQQLQAPDDTSSFLRSVIAGRFQRRLAPGQAVPGRQLLLHRNSELPGQQQQQQQQHPQQTREHLAPSPQQQDSNDGSTIIHTSTSSGVRSSSSSGSKSVHSPPSSAGPSRKLPAAAAATSSSRGQHSGGVAVISAAQIPAAALMARCGPVAAVSCSPAAASCKVGLTGTAGLAPAAATSSSAATAVSAVAPASAVLDTASSVRPAVTSPKAAVPPPPAAAAATILTAVPAVPHSNRKWAVLHLRERLEKWQQQQQQQQQAGVAVEELGEAAGLRRHLDAYAWLNQQLQGLRVYCEIVNRDRQATTGYSSSISCLDPRSAAQVIHSTHGSSSLPGGATHTISCERYVLNKYGAQLQLPACPCIVVELSEEAQQRYSSAGGSEQEQYRTYPLEFCWIEQIKPQHGSQLKRRGPRHTWDPTPITPDPAGLAARTAPWIAAALIQEQQGIDITVQQAAPAALMQGSAAQSVQSGLKRLIAALLPSKDEDADMHCVVKAVSNAIHSAKPSGAWTVARAKSVGSVEKRTNLAGTSDLDIIIVLKCNTVSQQPFEACRMQLLGQVQQQLCKPLNITPPHDEGVLSDAREWLRGLAAHGWQLLDCVPCYYLTLQHPLLHMQLDLQVAQYQGETQEQQWQGVMQPVQKKAERDAAQHGQLPAVMPARQRTTDLTELSVVVVTGVDRLYKEQHGQPSGYGRLATDVIRLCKAFARYGLPVALRAKAAPCRSLAAAAGATAAAAGATAEGEGVGVPATGGCSSSSLFAVCNAGTAAAGFKGPPAYMWEILVLFVLQKHAAGGTYYHQADPLALFMAVLQETSVLLCTGDAHEALQRAVVLNMSCVYLGGYSVEDTLKFRQSWGSGRVHTPYIINPVDPTFNCTVMQQFRAWDAVAEAAGQLHAQLVEATESIHDGGGGGGGSGCDLWQHVLSSSTLRPVWDAFIPGKREAQHLGPAASCL